jgi:uncharacterized protein YndB with AHSA1/START domain
MPQIILIEKSTVIPATPARLYKALTDAKQLSRWLADQVESDPRPGGPIVIKYDSHEKRGEYRRLIPGVEVGIRWIQFEEQVPEDITGFRIDRVTRGTRVRVVDFATPEDAGAAQTLWARRLKRLKSLYPARPASQKTAARKAVKPGRASKTKTAASRKSAPKKAKKK